MKTITERKNEMRQRTKAFASLVVRFYVGLDKRREELRVLGKQLLRSGTSVAANYRESSRARSVDEFIAKVEQCAQEADDGAARRRWRRSSMSRPVRLNLGGCPPGRRESQSQLWLELLRDDCGVGSQVVSPIWQEADELIAIFVTMAKNTKERESKV
jgi:hypothetical protein